MTTQFENLTILADELEMSDLDYEYTPGDIYAHEVLPAEFSNFAGCVATANVAKTNFSLAA